MLLCFDWWPPCAIQPFGALDRGHLELMARLRAKERASGATTVTVTRNEILDGVKQSDKFVLAVLFVNPDDRTEDPSLMWRIRSRESRIGKRRR